MCSIRHMASPRKSLSPTKTMWDRHYAGVPHIEEAEAQSPGEEMLAVKSHRKLVQQKLWTIERRLERLRKEGTQHRYKEELMQRETDRRETIRQIHQDKTDFLGSWRHKREQEQRDLKLKVLEARIAQREKISESRDLLHKQRKVRTTQTQVDQVRDESFYLRKLNRSFEHAEMSRRSSRAKLISSNFNHNKEQRRTEEERRKQESMQHYSFKIDSERDLVHRMELKFNKLKTLEDRLLEELRMSPRLKPSRLDLSDISTEAFREAV